MIPVPLVRLKTPAFRFTADGRVKEFTVTFFVRVALALLLGWALPVTGTLLRLPVSVAVGTYAVRPLVASYFASDAEFTVTSGTMPLTRVGAATNFTKVPL